MSHVVKKPNIKLIIVPYWFNVLLSTLEENAQDGKFLFVKNDANLLINKIMKYSRPYTHEETGINYVDIRFFPDEAIEIMWQLLYMCVKFREHNEDFYSRLKEK